MSWNTTKMRQVAVRSRELLYVTQAIFIFASKREWKQWYILIDHATQCNVGICNLLCFVLHIWYNNKCGYTWKQGRSVQEQDRPMSQGPGYRCDMQNVWRSQRSRRVLEMKAAEDLRREILVTRSLHHFSMLLVRPFLIMTNINSTNSKTLEHLRKLYS